MHNFVLNAQKREILGKRESRRIKNAGKIPAIIYSKSGNINISLDDKEFCHQYFKGRALTSVAEINFDNKKIKAVAHKIELDPVTDHPIHIDFIICEEKKDIRFKPSLNFINQDKSPGLKKGGFLHIVLRRVEAVSKDPKFIVDKIDIDTGSMQVGHKVKASNLQLPEGVSLLKKNDFSIASIIGRGSKSEDEVSTAATPAAGAAAATPAAGAPAAAATPAAKQPAKPAKK
jgi:large subunit ribosomal protein L25